MDIPADLDVLKGDISREIQRLRKSRSNNKYKAANIAIYTGAVAAITTVCIGIGTFVGEELGRVFGLISLVTSASISVVSAWDGIFNHKKLWVSISLTLNQFYELDTDICHLEAQGDIDQETRNKLYIRFKKILADSDRRWYQIRDAGVETIES